MTTIEIPLVGPAGEPVDLIRTFNSHGFVDLSPTRLNGPTGFLAGFLADSSADSSASSSAGSLEVTLRVRGARPRRVRVAAGRRRTASVTILGPDAGARVQHDVEAGVRRVLRMDRDLSAFYAAVADDPDLSWVASGAGRMLQSPTVFEDVVKTICTTNCAWSATVRMVNAIVTHLGEPATGGDGPLTNAFPTPAAMAAADESFYRGTVRAGYRGAYLIGLARSVAGGALDLEALETATPEELSDDELEERLLELPGVGPYAAAHIMMTLGRDSRLILDSWTRPTYARLLGRTKLVSDTAIRRRFRRYGDHAGLAFWLFLTRDWVD